ncbi:hypothetical protein BR93DRAFT_178583 [Coniochaeta sp. PMI_546]|nr:hypothetical protein BR93DRAFT_178583 [Coniochaeta sp. PMI_546]
MIYGTCRELCLSGYLCVYPLHLIVLVLPCMAFLGLRQRAYIDADITMGHLFLLDSAEAYRLLEDTLVQYYDLCLSGLGFFQCLFLRTQPSQVRH